MGCATTSTFQELDPVHFQSIHNTEFVLLTHPPIKYFWELKGDYSTSNIEIQRDAINKWGITYQKSQKKELDLVEPYFTQFQNPTLITQELYFKALQQVLTVHKPNFLQLMPYSGTVEVNDFEQKEPSEKLLPYSIPVEGTSTPPEWYMVLEVNDIGLIKTGITGGRGASSLFDALSGALTTALSDKHWFAWFSGQIMIADANSYEILWKSVAGGSIEIEGKLEELVEDKQYLFPKCMVEAIALAATKSALSLIKNQYVYGLDETTVKYKLKPEELEPFMDRFFK